MGNDREGDARARFDPAGEGAARHGIAAPRGQSAPGSRGGRFTRMFPSLPACDIGEAALDALAERMRLVSDKSGRNKPVPAGYTYLGQFVDHDITFDPTSMLQRDNDPHALVNFRTPRFDLDSLYGSGPAAHPFLYDWSSSDDPGVTLLVGSNSTDPHLALAPIDLPRNAQGRALIADGRNDEHLIISQLHLLFVQFHNKVVGCVRRTRPQLTTNELFDEAQRIVRWHYQWIVTHDFLPKIVGHDMVRSVTPGLVERPGVTATEVDRRIYRWRELPAIPVEFSAAAYRFGHSMVRNDYRLNEEHVSGAFILPGPDPPAVAEKPNLGGFRWLPAVVKIEWQRFFGPGETLPSMGIDHSLASRLFTLPPDSASLASLNLRRGRALGLPSGTDVALALGQEPLDEDELLPRIAPNDELKVFWPETVEPEARAAVLRSPPLWFYLLREAHARGDKGKHLGPIGGRIVTEVLVGLLEGDPQSFLRRQPTWTPKDCAELLSLEAGHPGICTMAHLVRFAAPPESPPALGGPPPT